MKRDYKVSVIIATYNRCKSVERALNALSVQNFPAEDYEVIVSIDGSEDGTKEMVQSYKSNYNLHSIWHPNSGRASACNRGIRDAQGVINIILDDDMEPSRDFIRAHYTAHQCNTKLGVIGAVPIFVDHSSSPVVSYVGSKFNSHLKKISTSGYTIQIRDFYSGNFSILRENMLEVGIFDEEFRIYGNEDVELAHRLLKSGIKLVYDAHALCTQHYEKDFKGLAKDTIAKGETAILLTKKYPDAFIELKLIEYNFTGWKWRSLRICLIWCSMLIPVTTDVIVFFIRLFDKSNRNIQKKLYSLGLDYFYWLGVWSAIKNDKNDKQLISKIKSYKKTQICTTP